MRKLMFITLLCLAGAAYAEVPHIFQSGQPARAADVNQNFQHLNNKADGSISDIAVIRAIGVPDGLITVATCPGGSTPISASCVCDGDGTTRNFGVLAGCTATSQGAAGLCFEDATYNPALPWPETLVFALCLVGQKHDGTIASQAMGIDIKIQSEEHGEVINRLVEQITNRRTLMQR
jgi:hypothetical protein